MRRAVPAISTVGLAALGCLLLHEFAYGLVIAFGLVSDGFATEHGHVSTLWALVSPGAVAAWAWFVLGQLRTLGLRIAVRATHLSAGALVLFLLQETVERLVAGRSVVELITSPVMATAVLLAPVVGRSIVLLVSGTARLLARLTSPEAPIAFTTAGSLTPAELIVPLAISWLGLGSRGPPPRM